MKIFHLTIALVLIIVLTLGGMVWADDEDDSTPDEDREVYFVPVDGATMESDRPCPVDAANCFPTLFVGGVPEILRLVVSPPDATNKNVEWSSSNTSVAIVEPIATGGANICRVYPVGVGTATITATTEDGSFSQECNVTVLAEEATPPTGFGPVSVIILVGGLLLLAGVFITFKKLKKQTI